MPRIKAKLIKPDGSLQDVSRKIALQLLETTDYQMVSRRPLVIRPFVPEHFQEERRFFSGRLVKGASRGKSAAKRRGSFNGQPYTSSSIPVGLRVWSCRKKSVNSAITNGNI